MAYYVSPLQETCGGSRAPHFVIYETSTKSLAWPFSVVLKVYVAKIEMGASAFVRFCAKYSTLYI